MVQIYVKPTTRAQREACWNLFKRNAPLANVSIRLGDGCAIRAYRKFRRGFHLYYGGYLGGPWCGMFIGIEPDGYTHS